MAACALDDWPVTEATLSMVAEHVSSSPGRSTCLLEAVALHFVYETDRCLAKFLEALADLRVNDYRLQPEGGMFFMVKDAVKDTAAGKDDCVTPCDAAEGDAAFEAGGGGWDPEASSASTPIMPRVATESTIEQSTDSSVQGPVEEPSPLAGGGPLGLGLGVGPLLSGTPLGAGLGHTMGHGLGHGMLLNPDSDICNWSEAAARHSEVSSLMESALGTEDGKETRRP